MGSGSAAITVQALQHLSTHTYGATEAETERERALDAHRQPKASPLWSMVVFALIIQARVSKPEHPKHKCLRGGCCDLRAFSGHRDLEVHLR